MANGLKKVAGTVAAGIAYMRYKKNRAENKALQEETMDFRKQQESNRNMKTARDQDLKAQRNDIAGRAQKHKEDMDTTKWKDGTDMRAAKTQLVQHDAEHASDRLANETMRAQALYSNAQARMAKVKGRGAVNPSADDDEGDYDE